MSATILLVEDNPMNRDMLSRRLAKRGYRVVLAGDGGQALEQVRASTPDLVLMDMSLPVLDGWEVTRRLKADPVTRGIPVIGLTAHAMAGDRERALAAGADDFDTKPVDLARLLATIEAALARAATPQIERPAIHENLATLVDHAVRRCGALGGGDAVCNDVRLSVEEVCMNVIQHGYRGRDPGPVRVAVRREGSALMIVIADEAPPFDPADAPPPDLSSNWRQRREGGLGWHVVRSVMDEVRYTRSATGNVVTLIKRLEG